MIPSISHGYTLYRMYSKTLESYWRHTTTTVIGRKSEEKKKHASFITEYTIYSVRNNSLEE